MRLFGAGTTRRAVVVTLVAAGEHMGSGARGAVRSDSFEVRSP